MSISVKHYTIGAKIEQGGEYKILFLHYGPKQLTTFLNEVPYKSPVYPTRGNAQNVLDSILTIGSLQPAGIPPESLCIIETEYRV